MAEFRAPFSLHHLQAYPVQASEVAFLLGGIGTGNVSVGSRGQLKDWELFNRPGKGNKLPNTFFAIHTENGGRVDNRVLEGPILPPYSSSHGFFSAEAAGLPRMEGSTLRGEYPLCSVDFEAPSLPVHVTLEAFTPFIPLNAEDSGIPGAVLRYRVRNLQKTDTFVSVAGTLCNMTNFEKYNLFEYVERFGEIRNVKMDEPGLHGVSLESRGFEHWHPQHASMALATTCERFTVKPEMYMGAWWDSLQDFWDDFCQDGRLSLQSPADGDEDAQKDRPEDEKTAALAAEAMLAPGEEKVFEFLLTWYFPNRVKGWREDFDPRTVTQEQTIRNHYALKLESAWDAARYLARNLPRLEEKTRDFHEAFFGSTLPREVLDAASANITALRSPTCFWLENGCFMGWEGCFDRAGCCEGNCTHVWNYEQTVAFLFPQLEQSMRETEFLWETEESGRMAFRAFTMLEGKRWEMHPATDGQLGTIVGLYRDYMLSGKPELLERLGPVALKALDFSISYWDQDGDGVLDSQQHNTYDIEFYGMNAMSNSMFYAALLAGERLALALDEPERAQRYRVIRLAGSEKMDRELWNGEYYIQKIPDVNAYKYQFGQGVLSDQLLGQYDAFVAGLGYVLPQEHVKEALLSIYRYNLRHGFAEHHNPQRTYALGDETGLLLCSWPRGGRPRFPFVYSDEVWTGIEYQVAATMIYAGMAEEGLEIVRGVRGRYDGYRRNPFNEVECGHHYARSMASWALVTALSGYSYDMSRNEVSFAPRIHAENFRCFYSNGREWGVYTQEKLEDGTYAKRMLPLYTAGTA